MSSRAQLSEPYTETYTDSVWLPPALKIVTNISKHAFETPPS